MLKDSEFKIEKRNYIKQNCKRNSLE